MHKGLSLIEMLITLAVVAVIIVTVFQIFITIHSAISKSNSKMTDFNQIRYHITSYWQAETSTGGSFQAVENDGFFDELREEGISSDLLSKLENSTKIIGIRLDSAEATYTTVSQL